MSADANFIPYPDVDDDNFYDTLFAKKEFSKTAYSSSYRYKTTEEICTKGEFKMQNHQEFVRNFISPETPYNGALLFHGTGVGKTCAAIGITEGLRDYVKNKGKIYILSSENIRPNFYKELYDPEREAIEKEFHSIPGSYQCASDRYYPEGLAGEERQAAVNAIINQYYEFYGFGSFANYVDIRLGADLPTGLDAKILNEDGSPIDIGEYFANSVIIIDEAHGIAGDTKRTAVDDDETEKDEEEVFKGQSGDEFKTVKKRAITTRSLFQVLLSTIIPRCKESGNPLKIILLTATPMKDNIGELADLLELLNVNDGRIKAHDKTWRNEYFPKENEKSIPTITEEMEEGIKKLCKGYISYVKGNNPITFPIPLNPPLKMLYEPARDATGQIQPMFPYKPSENSIDEEDISSGYDIKLANGEPYKFELVKCPMSLYHFKCYLNLLKDVKKASSDIHSRMASNIVFPNPRMDNFDLLNIKDTYGNTGFANTFVKRNINKHNCFTYKPSAIAAAKAAGGDGNFLRQADRGGLQHYSEKFSKFIDFLISGPSGVAYAYSEFVNCGALIGSLILEANGFVRFTPELKKYIDKTTGLPIEDIQKKYPPAHLLHLDGELKRKPSLTYRCSICNQIYNDCQRAGASAGATDPARVKHAFKVSTYILVTGGTGDNSYGTIADIAEATSNNIDGTKIRIVMGTKTTGQGVDFKWVRQVHILDPWHNNTRIYQAIGRGLRHCSHADLPKEKRNVTIYRYSSSVLNLKSDKKFKLKLDDPLIIDGSNTGLTYRDLYRETVDEHMYQRVVLKDLTIKKIERILKKAAVDCELNRMRNYFESDKDYSRECDYDLCKYSCDGFKKPIQYIRKFTRSNDRSMDSSIDSDSAEYSYGTVDDNDIYTELEIDSLQFKKLLEILPAKLKDLTLSFDEIWDLIKPKFKILETSNGEEMLVDIPLITIDDSTYDIYFSAPQVDRSIKIISKLYQKVLALSLKNLLYLVKRTDPMLEDNFIYIAIDKLIGNLPFVKPVTFIDRYGRTGHLVYHNGYYVYKPFELKDLTTPLLYRTRPLSIKNRYYNMDQLAPKPKTQKYITETMDTSKLDDILESLKDNFTSVLNLINMYVEFSKLLLSEHKYIIEHVVENAFSEAPLPRYYYVIEYYLRTGVLVFTEWDETIFDIEKLCKEKKVKPVHFISVDGNALVYEEMRDKSRKWSVISIDEITLKKDHDFKFPRAPRFNDKKIPSNTHPFLQLSDLYGFVSAANTTRSMKPIIGNMEQFLRDMVKRFNSNYPDVAKLSSMQLKIVEESLKTVKMTKAGTVSKRNNLSGLSCLSATKEVTLAQIKKLKDIITENYSSLAESITVEKFFELLAKTVTEVYNSKGADRKLHCNTLEVLLIVLDYYSVNTKKWYISPLETEFYLPSKSKKV
jgi:hypothetical protein